MDTQVKIFFFSAGEITCTINTFQNCAHPIITQSLEFYENKRKWVKEKVILGIFPGINKISYAMLRYLGGEFLFWMLLGKRRKFHIRITIQQKYWEGASRVHWVSGVPRSFKFCAIYYAYRQGLSRFVHEIVRRGKGGRGCSFHSEQVSKPMF